MKIIRYFRYIFFLGLIGGAPHVFAEKNITWHEWIAAIESEALSQGIEKTLLDQVFTDMTPDSRILALDQTQPEKRMNFLEYRKSRIDPYRIVLGERSFKRHQEILEEIGNHYGVNPCFVTALWGMESSYGNYTGHFPVIRSLATLAYDKRRSEFFRKELLLGLHILNEHHVDIAHFKGEWAGASGHPQFLPSSWARYAVDYDQDGRKDIWTSYSDALASIANYLVKNGWEAGQPWAVTVTLPEDFDSQYKGLETMRTVSDWLKLGVKPTYGALLPDEQTLASIISPEGGPPFMVFNNFKVLMKYNNSIFYAASVGYLADEICKKIHSGNVVSVFS